MAVTEVWLSALLTQNQVLPLERSEHTTKNDSKCLKSAMVSVQMAKHPTPRQIIWLFPRLYLHSRRKAPSQVSLTFSHVLQKLLSSTHTPKKILKSFFLFLKDIISYTILSQGNRRDRSPRDCAWQWQVWVPACLIQTPRYIMSSRLSPVPS